MMSYDRNTEHLASECGSLQSRQAFLDELALGVVFDGTLDFFDVKVEWLVAFVFYSSEVADVISTFAMLYSSGSKNSNICSST